MNSVLAFLLILAVLSSGHGSVTVTTTTKCFTSCPAGYYKIGVCPDPSSNGTKHLCDKCGANTFTDIENSSPKCEMCQPCSSDEVELKSCRFDRNVECACKEDFYNSNPSGDDRNCRSCKMIPDLNSADADEYETQCNPCQRAECLQDPGCASKMCPNTTTSSSRNVTGSSTTARPPVQQASPDWSWFVWFVVVLAVIFGFLLFWKLFAPRSCSHWTTEKDVMLKKEPKFTEQRSHQGDASTTLTIKACEETPMMSLGPNPSEPEHPASVSILLPNAELRAARQDGQSKDWPAIVLYAIIKEVPLRRWKEFLRLLAVADDQLERVELEAGSGLGSMERQYLMLRLWSQRPSASLDDVFSALQYMDLTRCAQLLQENLENLQWRAESKPGFTV